MKKSGKKPVGKPVKDDITGDIFFSSTPSKLKNDICVFSDNITETASSASRASGAFTASSASSSSGPVGKSVHKQKLTHFDPEAYQRELEPWIHHNDNKIAPYVIGLLPNGQYRKVPTERVTRYIRKTTAKSPEKTSQEAPGEKKKNVIFNTAIFLDFGNGKDSNTVKEKNYSIREGIKSVQKDLKNKFRECPKLSGLVTQEQFDECLDVYENNQVYYQQKFEDQTIDIDVFRKKISVLEEWFICIIEPKPTGSRQDSEVEEWREREKEKLQNLYSSYCDPDLYEYLLRPPEQFTRFIKQCHQKMGLL